MSALEFITALNAVVRTLGTLGISLQAAGDAIAAAKAEGREFGAEDLQRLANRSADSLDALDAAIDRAERDPDFPPGMP